MRVNRNLLLFFLSFSRSLQSFYEQGPGIDIIQQRTHLSSTHVQDGETEASVADEFMCRWTREKSRDGEGIRGNICRPFVGWVKVNSDRD